MRAEGAFGNARAREGSSMVGSTVQINCGVVHPGPFQGPPWFLKPRECDRGLNRVVGWTVWIAVECRVRFCVVQESPEARNGACRCTQARRRRAFELRPTADGVGTYTPSPALLSLFIVPVCGLFYIQSLVLHNHFGAYYAYCNPLRSRLVFFSSLPPIVFKERWDCKFQVS